MHNTVVLPKPHTIPQDAVLAILTRCNKTREFMTLAWLKNAQLAKQGGRKAVELIGTLLSPETKEN